ncbi:MAG: hypothetical protein WC053_02315 [Sideroxydans sp.]
MHRNRGFLLPDYRNRQIEYMEQATSAVKLRCNPGSAAEYSHHLLGQDVLGYQTGLGHIAAVRLDCFGGTKR